MNRGPDWLVAIRQSKMGMREIYSYLEKATPAPSTEEVQDNLGEARDAVQGVIPKE